MVKPIRNEPKTHAGSTGQTTGKRSTTSYENTTDKVKAAVGNVDLSNASKASKATMEKHKVTAQKSSGDNLASLVTKGSGKQRAQVVANLAVPIFSKPGLANEKKIRSAHIAKPAPKMDAAVNKALGKNS